MATKKANTVKKTVTLYFYEDEYNNFYCSEEEPEFEDGHFTGNGNEANYEMLCSLGINSLVGNQSMAKVTLIVDSVYKGEMEGVKWTKVS